MNNFNKFLYILPSKEFNNSLKLLIISLVMAFLDMIGVASIMPFMSVLVKPEIIYSNQALTSFFEISNLIGVETERQFLIFLGILCFFLLVTSIIFKAFTIYFQISLNARWRHITAKNLMKIYLQQPYSWFLNHHSADVGKNILSEVNVVIDRGLGSLITVITQSVVCLALLLLLLLIDYKLTIIIGFSLGLIYLLILKFSKNYTSKLSKERLSASEKSFRILIESFGAFKEVKIGGLEDNFTNRFSKESYVLSRHSAIIEIIAKIPRLIIEMLIFGSTIILIIYLMLKNESLLTFLPIITIYALAFYRLIPSAQGIYNSITQINYAQASIDNMYNELKSLYLNDSYDYDPNLIQFNKIIKLKNIKFRYPDSSRTALKNINIEIPAYSTVALVGATGSGKTTIVDIILGLLEPLEGTIEVDGKKITRKNHKSWQKNLGYVPQQINLVDDTISANIAFGINPSNINQEAIERSAKIANIHEFIINELPLKYETIIGEQGIRLSGGQRQRIGIARALYHSPKVLIFDEATSALDDTTEKSVIKEVNNLKEKHTIIMIAHRLSTVEKCDKVILLENGEIKNYGKFEEILNNNFKNVGIKF